MDWEANSKLNSINLKLNHENQLLPVKIHLKGRVESLEVKAVDQEVQLAREESDSSRPQTNHPNKG